jgi:hypothetical protein
MSKRSVVSGIAVVVLLSGVAAALDCLERVGRSLDGELRAVATRDALAFTGDGALVRVIDLSSPASPVVVGSLELDSEWIRSVAVDGDRLYVGTSKHLHIVDVSSPANPVELGRLSLWDPFIWETALAVGSAGDTACVVTHTKLLAADVSDPIAPVVVGTWAPPGVVPYDVEVVGDRAFVTTWTAGLRVLDLTNPAMPTQIGSASAPAGRLDVIGDKAFIESDGLTVFDVSNPVTPNLIGQISFPGTLSATSDVAIDGDLAFISTQLDGLQVVDVSNPQQPVWTGTAPPVRINEVWMATAALADHAVVATLDHGVRVIAATDPTNPAHVAVVDSPGPTKAGAVADGILVTANGTRGIRTLDIAEPSAPSELAILPLGPDWTVLDVAVSGSLAVAVGWGFAVIDISDPSAPVVVGETPPWQVMGDAVEVVDNLAYVADQTDGLRIVDISDPGLPTELGSVTWSGDYWHYLDVSGSLVALSGEDRIEIIDVGNPVAPTAVASVDAAAGFLYRGVALSGTWLFVARGPSIHVFDLGTPSQPVETGVFSADAFVHSLGVRGSVLYAGTDWNLDGLATVKAWNIGQPSSPVPMGEEATAEALVDLAFGADTVVTTRVASGFEIFSVCQGPIFADGFESGDTSAWSSAVP